MQDDVIYRQAAIRETWREPTYSDPLNVLTEMRDRLEALPSAEQKLVRCKDCKHLFDGEHNANCCEVLMRKAKWLTEITVDTNWYCADAERRTDG